MCTKETRTTLITAYERRAQRSGDVIIQIMHGDTDHVNTRPACTAQSPSHTSSADASSSRTALIWVHCCAEADLIHFAHRVTPCHHQALSCLNEELVSALTEANHILVQVPCQRGPLLHMRPFQQSAKIQVTMEPTASSHTVTSHQSAALAELQVSLSDQVLIFPYKPLCPALAFASR